MTAYADVAARPDWLKASDKTAFERYLGGRRLRPQAVAMLALIDLAHDQAPFTQINVSGVGWQHRLWLAAVLLQQVAGEPALANGAELLQARLAAAIEAIDIDNIWLATGPAR